VLVLTYQLRSHWVISEVFLTPNQSFVCYNQLYSSTNTVNKQNKKAMKQTINNCKFAIIFIVGNAESALQMFLLHIMTLY